MSQTLSLLSWTWQWVHWTPMASTVTTSQTTKAPLICGGCAACEVLSCQYKPSLSCVCVWFRTIKRLKSDLKKKIGFVHPLRSDLNLAVMCLEFHPVFNPSDYRVLCSQMAVNETFPPACLPQSQSVSSPCPLLSSLTFRHFFIAHSISLKDKI